MSGNAVLVMETGQSAFAQLVTIGRHVLRADEPEQLGGKDIGPSPYELIMAALGTCTAMTIRGYANRHEWRIGTISVTTRHEKVASAPSGARMDRFDREITVAGELSEEQRLRLTQVAEACPVSLTLRHPSTVTVKMAPR